MVGYPIDTYNSYDDDMMSKGHNPTHGTWIYI